MEGKTPEEIIAKLCDLAECSEHIRQVHCQQYISRRWNPHPSQAFKEWWARHPHAQENIDVGRAFNCQQYRQEFLESRRFGIDCQAA
jgi:hypothetical protein